MNTRNDQLEELSDEEALDISPDLAAAQEEAAKKAAPADDDDDDDFDLLGDDEDDDDAGVDDDTGDDDEDADQDDEDLPAAARVPKVGKTDEKPKSKAQIRIEELSAKRRAAEKEAYEAHLRNVELERRIEALEKEKGTDPKPPAAAKPDPKNYEYGEADEKYIEDTVQYRLQQERSEWEKNRDKDVKEQDRQRLLEHYKKRDEKMTAGGIKKYGKDKWDEVAATKWPGSLARDLLDSEQGVDISYYLANNISKLREITTMTDAQRAKAIGRLEERFSARASAGKKRTKAPETPGGTRRAQRKDQDESRYGPEDQDEFDKAFFGGR